MATTDQSRKQSQSNNLPLRSSTRSTSGQHGDKSHAPSETDSSLASAASASASSRQNVKIPAHRIEAPGSVQAVAVDDDVLFAGVQGGSIVAWSLETYERLATVPAHKESVLGLALSDDRSLLFSTGADSVVNVWSTHTLQRLYSLYSHFEIGDVFCIVHSTKKQTLLWGAQNSSLQWHRLSTDANIKSPTSPFSPGPRKHRFFDSLGPGGSANVISDEDGTAGLLKNLGGRALIVPSRNYLPYAHKSYIYCMLLIKGLFTHDREEEVLVSGAGDGTIKLWSLDSLSSEGLVLINKFKNAGSNVLSLSYRGSFLYAGLSDGVANVYNLASNQLVQRLQIGHGDISQILVSTDSILCGTSQGLVKRYNDHFAQTECWKAADGKILAMGLAATETGHESLITGGNDCIVSFWNADSGTHGTATSATRSNDELVNTLREFVAYRTVAANPTWVRDCHDAVTFLRKRCNAFGATTTLLSPTEQEGVNPVLLAKFTASKPSKQTRTVLFYGHYDVVDAEYDSPNLNSTWNHDPFTLQALSGFLYGRGVTDNKGPILAAIYAVADLVQHNSLSCNVTFLLEGEEEAGSRGFRQTVQSAHDAIGPVDFILLSNSYWLDDHIPCLTFGMRGVIHASVTINSNKPDLHSGVDGKSVQHEPLKDLTVLLATLIGASGTKITIPDFYDTVDELSEGEAKAYAAITSSLLPGHPEIKNEKAFALSLMQRWRYPNLTVHRIEVPEAKAAVTISGSAKATISIRIVPSQTAEQIANGLKSHLQAQFARLQSANTLDVDIRSQADPWLGNVQSEIYTALKSAIVDVWNPAVGSSTSSQRSFPVTAATASSSHQDTTTDKSKPKSRSTTSTTPSKSTSTTTTQHASPQPRPSQRRASTLESAGSFTAATLPRQPLLIREGGSIPAISFLEHEFHAPAAMFPMGQASDNAHLDNERIRVENLYRGREVLKRVFAEL